MNGRLLARRDLVEIRHGAACGWGFPGPNAQGPMQSCPPPGRQAGFGKGPTSAIPDDSADSCGSPRVPVRRVA